MTKPVLPFVESIVLKPCNLKCHGCSTYSDLTHSGYTTAEEGIEELRQWSQRLEIQAWGAMGGEPLMNPQIREWIKGVRELLPNAQIRFITNGILLEKHFDIVEMLAEMGNAVFKITVHVEDERIERMIKRIHAQYTWEPVYEFGIHRFSTDREFKFQVTRPTKFYKSFRGEYINMQPHTSDAKAAFDVCIQQRCPIIYKNKLYKCGVAALQPEIVERFGQPNWQEWEPYLNTGLDLSCSDLELSKFVNNFGKPHAMCKQCPTADDASSLIDHTKTVTFK
jgi:organic radical activating enzyme